MPPTQGALFPAAAAEIKMTNGNRNQNAVSQKSQSRHGGRL
jgi:hypothetical protein